MPAYCTTDEIFTLGLSAQAFVSRPRVPDAVSAASATIRIKAHGLTVDDVITFEAVSGGQLPTGISGFTPYYPIPLSADLLHVATTPSGTPIASWASAGAGWGVCVDPLRRLAAHAVEVSAEIDEHLTAHDPPILVDPVTGKYPQVLVGLSARMAARAAVTSLQIENAQYRVAVDRLMAREAQDLEILAAWKAGKPIQPRPTDEDDLANNAARAGYGRRPAGWDRGYV
jgi:hypothetical protein